MTNHQDAPHADLWIPQGDVQHGDRPAISIPIPFRPVRVIPHNDIQHTDISPMHVDVSHMDRG